MAFYSDIVKESPFFMRELAEKLSDSKDEDDINKIYKKIYMQVRYYHKNDWECTKCERKTRGRTPLKCTFVGEIQEKTLL